MNDAPRDDLQAEDFRMTAHLLRELQVLRQRGNEDALFAVVRHRSGELVGLNELSWSRSQPTHVSQGSTGVKPAHRRQARAPASSPRTGDTAWGSG